MLPSRATTGPIPGPGPLCVNKINHAIPHLAPAVSTAAATSSQMLQVLYL